MQQMFHGMKACVAIYMVIVLLIALQLKCVFFTGSPLRLLVSHSPSLTLCLLQNGIPPDANAQRCGCDTKC